MPFDGSGNYVVPSAPTFPAIAGTTIVASYYNAMITDIATALNKMLTIDGQTEPTATISWNSQNLSNVGVLSGASASFTGNVGAATLSSTGLASLHSLALTTMLDEAYGGTGVNGASAANGALLIGNGTGYSIATITQGSGITITNGAGTITIAASGGGAGTTTNALTFAVSSGVAAGTTFNGSAARTIDYASVGAQPDIPRVQTTASAATVTPTFLNDLVTITAQAAALILANPTGTIIEGKGIVIRIKDNGTARAITYGSQYRAIGVTLPTTTVLSKTVYLGMVYNTADTKWDVLSVQQQA